MKTLFIAATLLSGTAFAMQDSLPPPVPDSALFKIFTPAAPWAWYARTTSTDTSFVSMPELRSSWFRGFPAAPFRPSFFPLLLSTVSTPLLFNGNERFNAEPAFQPEFISARTPFTFVHGEFSTKNAQGIRVMHSHNTGKRGNLTGGLNRFNGDGHFQRQKFNREHYFLTGNFISKRKGYGVLFSGEYRAMKREENGGIVSDSFMADPDFFNRTLIPVKLMAASSRSASRAFQVSQYFFITPYSYKDSDTVAIVPKHSYFFLETGIQDGWYVYKDANPLSGFYQYIYKDSSQTYDTSWCMEGNARFGLNLGGKDGAFRFYARSVFQEFWQEEGRRDYLDHYGGISFQLSPVNGESPMEFLFEYCLAGDRKGALNALARFRNNGLRTWKGKEKEYRFFAELNFSNQYPSYFLGNYYSNHFTFTGGVLKQLNTAVEAGIEIRKWNFIASTRYNLHQYATGLSELLNPVWYGSDIAWYEFRVRKEFKISGFWLGFDGSYILKEQAVTRIPDWLLKGSMHYQFNSKKKKIWTRIGLDLTYVSEYSPGVFIPALQLYAQNDSLVAGNYLFPDIYVALRVNWALLYLRCDHVTSGLFGYNYFIAPGYPADERTVRLGVVWRFFD